MSFPNPQDAPRDFLEHIKSLNLDSAVAAFLHLQTRPANNNRLKEAKVMEWCERMDTLLVHLVLSLSHIRGYYHLQGKLSHTMASQPAQKEVCSALHELCSKTIVDISVATAIAGVFANFTNEISKITEKLEDVDKAKSRGVSCQH